MQVFEELLAAVAGGDEGRAEAALAGVLELDQEALAPLLDWLKAGDVDQRWWAVRALAQSPHARVEWLLPALSDQAAEVRQAAALGLAGHPDERAIPALVQALADQDGLAAGLAAHALVANGPAAVPALLGVADAAPLAVRVHAIRALAEIKDPRAIPALMAALESDSAMLAHWAEDGLQRLGLDMIYWEPE